MPLVPLLALLSWSPLAFGADAAANPERTVASRDEVGAYVGEVRTSASGPVLLAAAGPDAERVALDVAGALPAGQVRVVRIGYIGDGADEVKRALASTGMTCAVRIGAAPSGGWSVTTHGTCAPGADAALPPAAAPLAGAPAAAPTQPGVSAIPGVGAALPSVQAAPAPPAAPAPLAAPPPPDPAVLQSTYDIVALKRVTNPKPRSDLPEAVWAVRDGRGRTLDALDFARRTGDLATERRIEREGATARSVGIGLAVGGSALAVAGLGVLVARNAGAPQWETFEPDITRYDTNAQYFEALAQAEADYRAAQDAHEIRKDDRVWIAGFLTGAGALALVASPFAARGATERRTLPALYWDPEDADALIEAHNASVRQRIGLPDPSEAPKAAVVTPPPAPEPDEEEHLEEDPPEDALPPEAAPPAPQAPTKDRPGGSGARDPGLRLTPDFGVAYIGLSGTF